MANIILHQFQGISVGLDKKDGYINATKLCAAYNLQNQASKKPDNWLRTQRSQEYIRYVASVSQKRETDLVIIRQGGSVDEQGTWLHPTLAIPFATWLSVEVEYQVSEWIREWHESKSLNKYPEDLIGHIEKSPVARAVSDLNCIVEAVLGGIGMDAQLIAQNKAEAIATMFPQYRPAIEGIKRDLLMPVESKLLCPTELAAIWEEQSGEKLSAIAFNKKLEAANLQKKTGNKTLPWQAIGCGIDHSEVVLDTATGHGKTVQRLMWHKSVIDLLT